MRVEKEYLEYIEKLVQLTKEDKIAWKKQNPTTIYYQSKTEFGETILSIQRIDNMVLGTQFMFQLTIPSKRESITIDSAANNVFRNVLGSLYSEAEFRIDKRGLDMLDSFIKGIK